MNSIWWRFDATIYDQISTRYCIDRSVSEPTIQGQTIVLPNDANLQSSQDRTYLSSEYRGPHATIAPVPIPDIAAYCVIPIPDHGKIQYMYLAPQTVPSRISQELEWSERGQLSTVLTAYIPT